MTSTRRRSLVLALALAQVVAGCGVFGQPRARPTPHGNFNAAPPPGYGAPPGHGAGAARPNLAAPRWTPVPATNGWLDPRWGPTLTDIAQRKPPRETGHWDDPATSAHELSHSIHFELRLLSSTDRKRNGFYVLGGRAAIVDEPAIRKADVAAWVPPSLRGSRYDHYLAGKPGWDARPLYVWDEWNAYVNGAAVAIERYQLGLEHHPENQRSDRVHAALEFTIYAMSLMLAVSQRDPGAFARDPQLAAFFAFNAERAMQVWHRGASLPPFRWDDGPRFVGALRSSPDAEALRATMRSLYGADWASRVFGF